MLTIGPISRREVLEVKALAKQHGCGLRGISIGRWWWRRWTLTVDTNAAFERDWAERERERLWWQAIK